MWSRDRIQPSRRSLRQTDNLGARSRRIISAAAFKARQIVASPHSYCLSDGLQAGSDRITLHK